MRTTLSILNDESLHKYIVESTVIMNLIFSYDKEVKDIPCEYSDISIHRRIHNKPSKRDVKIYELASYYNDIIDGVILNRKRLDSLDKDKKEVKTVTKKWWEFWK